MSRSGSFVAVQTVVEEEVERTLDAVRPILGLSGLRDHGAWFLGTDPSIPRWTGYAVVFDLIRQYMDRKPRSASALVAEPAGLVRSACGHRISRSADPLRAGSVLVFSDRWSSPLS